MYTHVHTGCHMWAVSTYQHSYIWQGFSRAWPHQSPIAMASNRDRSYRTGITYCDACQIQFYWTITFCGSFIWPYHWYWCLVFI